MLHLRVDPKFSEIERESLNIDPKKLGNKLDAQTKALSFVTMWGIPPDYPSLIEFAKKNNLISIEDACRGIGGRIGNINIGQATDISCFSLNIYKPIGVGEGGILVTDNISLHDRAAILGQPVCFGLIGEDYKKYFDTALGLKHQINPIAAYLALLQLEELDKRILQSNDNFEYFQKGIAEFDFLESLNLPPNSKRGCWSGFATFYKSENINELDKKLFVKALRAEGCNVLDEYQSNLLHATPVYAKNPISGRKPLNQRGDFPSSEKSIEDLIIFENICGYQKSTKNFIDQYIKAIGKVAKNYKRLIKGQI